MITTEISEKNLKTYQLILVIITKKEVELGDFERLKKLFGLLSESKYKTHKKISIAFSYDDDEDGINETINYISRAVKIFLDEIGYSQ